MKLEGRIVEYIENGKFICAIVREDNNGRLRLLNQKGREVNLPQNRIIQATDLKFMPIPSRGEVLALLAETAKVREELAKDISLEEIWEVLSEKSENSLEVDFLAGLYFGVEQPSSDEVAALLRAVISNGVYFKYRSGAIQVHAPEKVEQVQFMRQKEKEQLKYIARTAEILRSIWKEDIKPPDWNERDTTLRLLGDYYVFGKDAADYDLARKLIKSAGLTGTHDVFHLLVKAGYWDKNENIPLLRLGIPTSFNETALAETAEIEIPGLDAMVASGRRDFRDFEVMTIDGPGTRDFDDALHIERQGDNYLVGIHISDVGLFVKPGTALFEETLMRGTSIYFPEKPLAMLPGELSENKLSLLKNEKRPTLSLLVILSPRAEVIRFEIVPGIVSVKRQLTYHEADDLIREDKRIGTLAALSKLLQQRRVNNGALLLPLPELHINISDDDSIRISRIEADTPSRTLIAEFMILANMLGAQFVAEREAPGLFRCQPEPRHRIIDGFEKEITKVIQQRKRLSPMALLTTPKFHSGVGAPQYTTVTSPIRRLLDLIMQLQIKHLVAGRGIRFSKKDMKHFGGVIQTTLEKANQAKYLRQRYWILKYLQDRQGERLPALVIEGGPRRIHIFLEEFLLDADLPANPAFKVSSGDTVLVRLAKVDPLSNILKLEW